jgi:peptidoglycan/LPS O-acetylase OafA/YrhL
MTDTGQRRRRWLTKLGAAAFGAAWSCMILWIWVGDVRWGYTGALVSVGALVLLGAGSAPRKPQGGNG